MLRVIPTFVFRRPTRPATRDPLADNWLRLLRGLRVRRRRRTVIGVVNFSLALAGFAGPLRWTRILILRRIRIGETAESRL